MSTYTLREWETLPHGEGEGCIPEHFAECLAALARTKTFAGGGGGGVLEDRRHELRARGVVGVLATDGCSLEILPKIDVDGQRGSEKQYAAIRKRLVHMLSVALSLKIDTGQVTELDWQRETLLEILIRIFCGKLTDAVRRGIPRRYILQEEDLTVLRGTLDLPRQFTRHAANPSRLACKFGELSDDIALNRIMKATVVYLLRMSRDATNQQQLRELAFVYADISEVAVPALKWDEVVIDRTNRAWQELLGMARLFLLNRYQTTSTGSGRGTALLFEMNALFEEYVGRMIERALARTEFRVTLQGGRKYCLTSLDDERELFQTKPDILIWLGQQVVHVIDSKWKRISPRIDDPKKGVSQGDVYQMMAYAQLYKPPRLMLLYPHHEDLLSKEGVQAQFLISGQETIIETASVDVTSGDNMIARLKKIIGLAADDGPNYAKVPKPP